jgi:hypothetical protein
MLLPPTLARATIATPTGAMGAMLRSLSTDCGPILPFRDGR